jgi:multisubunit Na+/H+ antiporter MnhB subunit
MLVRPVVLAIDGFLSMNSLEPLFWMGTAYAVLRAVQGENKAAPLLTSARKTLGRWLAVCIGLIVLIALPNLLWEAHRDRPSLIWLHNAGAQGKNIVYGPGLFL